MTGVKPTYGRVSRYGMVAFASSLDQAGVFARTAADAAVVLQVMAGFDPQDSTSVDAPVPDYPALLDAPLKGLRIGLLREFFEGLEARNAALIEDALQVYTSLGADTLEVSLPHLALSVPTYYVVAPAECSSNLSRFDGVRFGYRCPQPKDLTDLYKRSRGEGFGAEVKRRIMTGTYVLSAGYYDAYYLKAQKVRRLITDDFRAAFQKVDLLIGPTTPTPAFAIGAKIDDPVTMYLNDIYTIGANLAGLPGLSVPCGFVDGLPMGLQLIGPHFSEARLLGAAHQFQRATDVAHPYSAGIRMMANWEVVIGLEIHAQLATKSKIFSGSADRLWRCAQQPGELGRPGLPRGVARAERGSRANGRQVRARHRRDGRAALDFRPQELLLSGFAERLSDQSIRAARGREGFAHDHAR